ncbi:hypothetical protein P9112_013947 [Eukaryota sp. TZLM1-RC]
MTDYTPSLSSISTNNEKDLLKTRLSSIRKNRRSLSTTSTPSTVQASRPSTTPAHQYFNRSLTSDGLSETLFHFTRGTAPKPSSPSYSGPLAPYLRPKTAPASASNPLTSTHYRVAPKERCIGTATSMDSSGRLWSAPIAPSSEFTAAGHLYGPSPSATFKPDHYYESKVLTQKRKEFGKQQHFSLRETPLKFDSAPEINNAPNVRECVLNKRIRPCCRPKSSKRIEQLSRSPEQLGLVNLIPGNDCSIAIALHPQKSRNAVNY